ncbi:MAG: hypothetical protein EOM20_02745 [Spartobacteria bacterium]|nr:hypothetical protein [Spartobacteria bacterium]
MNAMHKWKILLATGFLCLGAAAGAQVVGVPLDMNYQGVLTQPDGQPVAGDNLTVNFRIYDAEKGGTLIWSTRQLVTTDTNGIFNALLGDDEGETVPGASNQVHSLSLVFTSENADARWLEIEVVHQLTSVMSPRQRFASVPYAYQAGNAAGSRGDFTVGRVLTGQSNAYLRGSVSISDDGQESLVFNDTVYNTAGLTVSQKMIVATAMKVDGAFSVHGNALFSNDTAFTQSVAFDGPAHFNKGVSLRGNTSAFGAFQQLAAKGPDGNTHTDTGTVTTNGFLLVRLITNDHNSGNTVTFTVGGVQFGFKADWATDGSDSLHYKDSTLFPVKAGTTWTISNGGGHIGYVLLYRPIS